ncbi:MAG TPA: O-antigen ligase family protein [Rhizomicrobium sp.]|jgi:O-antigen ligase|nr:O-antigen ligase family protein [Rhizomicrobium sp.]
MALETSVAAPENARTQGALFAEVSFLAFLLLIFVTLKPFAIRDMSLLPLGDSGTGAGDAWRQVCYLGAFSAIALSAYMLKGARMFACMSPLLALLLGWCLISGLWAQTPDIAFRRAGLEIVIALSAAFGVQAVGPERSLTLLRYVLGAILVLNFVSIVLVHQAVHLSDESDRQLIGNWRGLYYHKNIAGAVSAITALLFFFRALDTRRVLPWLIFAAAVVFTVMTRSKTSMALLPIAVLAGVVFRASRRHTLNRWIVLTAGACLLAVAAAAVTFEFHNIERLISDPTELTGRVAIWQAEFSFIRDHPLLGAGFGSFADTGALSPLYNYVTDKWVQGEAHGHNAYLQLLVTIGSVGFALAMLALIVRPAISFGRIEGTRNVTFFAPLFAIYVFELFHNAVESDFLEGDGPAWVAFLILLSCLHAGRNSDASTARVRPLEWSAP